jgi:phosphoserine phosphatase
LEIQIDVYKRLEQASLRRERLKSELRNLRNEGKSCHEQLTEIAKKGQEIHGKMLTKISESKKIKDEADNAHEEFLQAREKLNSLRKDMAGITDQIRQLREEIREKQAREKKRNDEHMREILEGRARDKLKRGEKLTWEEFQLLAEKGMIKQD